VSNHEWRRQLTEARETIRVLQEELAETNRGLLALTLELEQRVDERTQELRAAYAELQKTNAEVLQTTLELQAANRELEAFSYSASHDLRAPLRGIDGFSYLLLEEYSDHLGEDGQYYLQRIREACRRLTQIIDDMLMLSRVTRSKMRKEQVDLSGLAEAVTAELQQMEPQRQAEVVIVKGAVAAGDAGLPRAALENLLCNAWKFTNKQPRTRIEFGCAGTPPIYFVRDNGVGFDMAHADKLFGVFQRLHTDKEFPGTGIGLATVQRIIQGHGGRIWAEAAVGQGATFYFTLAVPVPLDSPPLRRVRHRSPTVREVRERLSWRNPCRCQSPCTDTGLKTPACGRNRSPDR
jgi:light-regulated signal transduction histidine kinase (bacteriophytochrome)